jgi:lysozyme
MSRQKISRAGLDLIERFEGMRRTAARLPDGRWTIGYGHTRSARAGAEVGQADAEALLYFDLLPVMEAVDGLVSTPLTQNQFDALIAFAFNVGIEAFRDSDVLKRINQGRMTEAAMALDVWRKADIDGDPRVLDALVRRRAAEKALFLTPAGGLTSLASPSALVRPSRDILVEASLPDIAPVEIEAPLEGPLAEVRLAATPAAEPEALTPTEAVPATVFSITPVAEREPPLPDASAVAPADTVTLASSEGETAALAPATAEPVASVVSDDVPVETSHELEVQAVEANEPGAEALTPEAEAGLAPDHGPEHGFVPSFDAVSYFAPHDPVEQAHTPAAAPEPQAGPETTVEAAPEPEAPEPAPEAAAEPTPGPTVMAQDAPVGVQAWAFAPIEPVLPTPLPPAFTRDPVVAPIDAPVAEAPAPETPAPEAPAPETPAPEAPPAPAIASPNAGQFVQSASPDRLQRSLAEANATSSVRLYGPMAAIGLMPGAPVRPTPEAPAPAPPVMPTEPATHFGPPAVPESEVFADIVAEPSVSSEMRPPVAELVLTPPPEDWDPDAWRRTEPPAPVSSEPEDQGTPLFDQAWAGGQTARIVRHEEPDEPAVTERSAGGLFILLGVVGVAAFAGSVAAFFRGRAGGADEMTIYAWVLGLIGIASTVTSVYFLLKRLGGSED